MARSVRNADTVVLAVVAVALLGTAIRLVGLGDRAFHWEEARIGYWTLRSLETGTVEYRPIAGGPLLYVLNRYVFTLMGVSDATARLPVALLGGGLPLVALLFRDRLDRVETVALAVLLASAPPLLYYSRFLGGDVPLAVFSLLAVGCALRYYDRGTNRYLYGCAAAAALAVANSRFVVGYVLCLVIAAMLTVDHPRLRGEGTHVRARIRTGLAHMRSALRPVAIALGIFGAVHLFLFAPRSGDAGGAHLWDPTTLPAVLQEAFVAAPIRFVGVHLVSRGREGAGHELLPYLTHYVELLAATALAVVVLAIGAALADRYWMGSPRPLVAFGTYWAGSALLIFPIATETRSPWVLVHLTLPLTIPAAVAGGWLLRVAAGAYSERRARTLLAVGVVLVAIGGSMGATAATAYGPPDVEDRLVDHAQPGSDLDPLVEDVSAAIADNEGTDVLYYGPELHVEGDTDRPPVEDGWASRLPLPWYFERLGAETDSVPDEQTLAERASVPPVVVADRTHRSTLEPRLEGYNATEYDLSLWDRTVVVFVEQ